MKLRGINSSEVFDDTSLRWHGINFEPLDLEFFAEFKPEFIRKELHSIWRYESFLPAGLYPHPISLGEGWTPMIECRLMGAHPVLIKMDHYMPTGSYKDRGASALMTYIHQTGIKDVVQDSSGNAGISIAAYAAAANIQAKIYLPENTSSTKLSQMQLYGAQTILVKGSRQEAANQAFEMAKNSYYASHCFHPYFFQGTKTFAYEVCEQLNWQAPDTLILPVGNGTLLFGAILGLRELFAAGVIQKIPKIIAIQAENCAPLFKAFNGLLGSTVAGTNESLAQGIAISNPIRGQQLLKMMHELKGEFMTVSENEIKTAWKMLVKMGHLIEPTSAATIAGVIQYQRHSKKKEVIVSLFSGTGLKSSEKWNKLLL